MIDRLQAGILPQALRVEHQAIRVVHTPLALADEDMCDPMFTHHLLYFWVVQPLSVDAVAESVHTLHEVRRHTSLGTIS